MVDASTRRPRWRRLKPATVAIALLAVIGAGSIVATIGGRAGPPTQTPGPSPSLPATDLAADPGGCELAPGAAVGRLVVSGPDTSDDSQGRWRMCLDDAPVLDLGGVATCEWADDRRSVLYVSGSTHIVAGGSVVVVVTLGAPGEIDVGITSIDDEAAGFYGSEPWSGFHAFRLEGGRAGVVRFDEVPFTSPKTGRALPLVAGPRDLTGIVRWRCDPAPPPRPGLGIGRLTIQLDLPIDRIWSTQARCRWRSIGGVLSVGRIEGSASNQVDAETAFGVSLDRNVGQTGVPELTLWVSQGIEESNEYQGDPYSTNAHVLRMAASGSSGRVRYPELVAYPGAATLVPSGNRLGAVVEWLCGPPLAAAPEENVQENSQVVVRAGQATIRLGDATLEDVQVTCQIDVEDHMVTEVDGGGVVGDQSLDFVLGRITVVYRTAASGAVLGEYVGQLEQSRDDPDRPGEFWSTLRWAPRSLDDRPLPGVASFAELALDVTFDCRAPETGG